MTRTSSHRLLTVLGAASALALLAAPAIAQKYPSDRAYYDNEIVVVAPGVHRESTGRRTGIGARIEELSTQRIVSTADLDLRSQRDVNELRRRIHATAREACNELERESSGIMLDSTSECVRDAVREAMAEADARIYYARG